MIEIGHRLLNLCPKCSYVLEQQLTLSVLLYLQEDPIQSIDPYPCYHNAHRLEASVRLFVDIVKIVHFENEESILRPRFVVFPEYISLCIQDFVKTLLYMESELRHILKEMVVILTQLTQRILN